MINQKIIKGFAERRRINSQRKVMIGLLENKD
jgi:hypothetical protein